MYGALTQLCNTHRAGPRHKDKSLCISVLSYKLSSSRLSRSRGSACVALQAAATMYVLSTAIHVTIPAPLAPTIGYEMELVHAANSELGKLQSSYSVTVPALHADLLHTCCCWHTAANWRQGCGWEPVCLSPGATLHLASGLCDDHSLELTAFSTFVTLASAASERSGLYRSPDYYSPLEEHLHQLACDVCKLMQPAQYASSLPGACLCMPRHQRTNKKG